MEGEAQNRFSGSVTVFHERPLPERGAPAGYAALIDVYALAVPLPRTLSAIGQHHRIIEREGWRMLTPRHAPSADLEGHLTFALKYEGLDLAVLNRLFHAVGAAAIEALVLSPQRGDFNEDLRNFDINALHAALRVQLSPEDVDRFLSTSVGIGTGD